MAAKVTICIPTYNRAPMLRYLLHDLTAQAGTVDAKLFRIVVSDNCSTDGTADIIDGYRGAIPLVSFKRSKNFGAYNNVLFAYSRSQTEYTIYCADDDVIDLKIVGKIVDEMDAMPEVGAVYCPWALQDGAAGEKHLSHFDTIPTTLFKKGDFKTALDSILVNHLFPEIAVFRTRATDIFPFQSTVTAWYFTVFPMLLAEWDIVVKDKDEVFYTFFLNHPTGKRTGAQVGNTEAATAWDGYRGGLEFFAQTVQAKHGYTRAELTMIMHRINDFIARRQIVAMRWQLRVGNYIDAYYLSKRLKIYRPSEVDAAMDQGLRIAAAIEHCFLRHFSDRGSRKAILVGRFPGPLVELVKRWGVPWFMDEKVAAPGTPRIDWDGEDPAWSADATAARYLRAYPA